MTDLGKRTAVALVGGGLLLAAALWHRPLFYVALWAIGLGGFVEGWRLLARRGAGLPWAALAWLVLGLAGAAGAGRQATGAFFLLACLGLAAVPRGAGLLAPAYVGLFPVVLGATAVLSYAFAPKLVVALLLSVWAADVGAYVAGFLVGRTPLAPSISPKKTVEGAVGGLVLAAAVGAAVAPILPFAAWKGAVVGAVAGLFGPLGDLAESRLKRFCEAKDSGALLPGHGGLLDRFDAFAAAAAALAVVRVAWRLGRVIAG